MSVKDVIKSSVYETIGSVSGVTIEAVFLVLAMACLVGGYIFMVYKLSSKSAFYSKDLNITMAGMPVIVAAIMLAMQSNLLVSLGMVGALSIVRFRNAVKNPLDLLYLFWSITAGIIVGVGLHMLAIALSIILTVLLLVLNGVSNVKAPELLIVRGIDNEIDYEVLYQIVGKNCKNYKEKARCIKNGEAEVIVEIFVKKKEDLLKGLNNMKCLNQVNYLSHDGEFRI